MRVLSRLFRRLFLEKLVAAHAGRSACSSSTSIVALAEPDAFARYLAPLRKAEWCRLRQAAVRRTRGGAGLSLPLHPPRRHRQQPADRARRQRRHLQIEGLSRRRPRPVQGHDARHDEFIRRFLIHVLPSGFHRIRHYGLFANGRRADNIAQARELLAVAKGQDKAR